MNIMNDKNIMCINNDKIKIGGEGLKKSEIGKEASSYFIIIINHH